MLYAYVSVLATGRDAKSIPFQVGVSINGKHKTWTVCPSKLNRHVSDGEWPSSMDPDELGHEVSADAVWQMGLSCKDAASDITSFVWEAQQDARAEEPPVIIARNPYLESVWLRAIFAEANVDFPFYEVPRGPVVHGDWPDPDGTHEDAGTRAYSLEQFCEHISL